MEDWNQYRFNHADGRELRVVFHVTHLGDARNIINDGKLRAYTILDENLPFATTDLKGTWFSANDWWDGSIYGNISFGVPWERLIAGPTFYWLGARKRKEGTAYQFLITNNEVLPNQLELPQYDPMVDGGPVQCLGGVWRRHPDLTSEFLVEDELTLKLCTHFAAVAHNPNKACVRYKFNCEEQTADVHRSSGRIIAYILGNQLHALDHTLAVDNNFRESKLGDELDTGIRHLVSSIQQSKIVDFNGNLGGDQRSILLEALRYFGNDQREEAFLRIGSFPSLSAFIRELELAVGEHFRVSEWKIPTD